MFLKCRYVQGIAWHVPIAAYSFFTVQKLGDPELQGPKKVLFHVIKMACYYLEYVFNS